MLKKIINGSENEEPPSKLQSNKRDLHTIGNSVGDFSMVIGTKLRQRLILSPIWITRPIEHKIGN